MKTKALEQKLRQLGFPLMEVEETVAVHKTLAEVVRSHETRYWEALPVLLANASQKPSFDYQKVYSELHGKKLKSDWSALLLLALSLYESVGVYFDWLKELKSSLTPKDKERLKELKKYLSSDENFTLGGHQFSAQRLKTLFQNYYQTQSESLKKAQVEQDQLSLEYAMSQLFSPKQKELVKKKFHGEKLTKTEREYYSRAVKKKVSALANAELHHLAQKLLE